MTEDEDRTTEPRYAKYGELPRRVPRDELVELQETNAPHDEPDQPIERWIAHPGGV
jgi:hypothetical protein